MNHLSVLSRALSFVLTLACANVALVPDTAYAQNSCFSTHAKSLQKYEALGDLRVNLDKSAVTQCAGSCYFEASVANAESLLSKHMGETVTFSRPRLFAMTMLLRLSFLSTMKDNMFVKTSSQGGIVDIISGGSTSLMPLVFNDGLTLYGPKSQADIYKENKVIKQLHRKIGELFYLRLHDPSLVEQDVKSKADAETSYTKLVKDSLPILIEEMKRIILSADLGPGRKVPGNKFGSKNLPVSFEKDSEGTARLTPETEQMIVDRLSQKEELLMTYFHNQAYVHKENGRDGFLSIPENTQPMSKEEAGKKKLGGGHGVVLVDVIRGKDGRIEYLVVRNSWGAQGDTDGGHHYISVKYLHFYGLHLSNLEVKVMPPEATPPAAPQ